MPFYWTFKLELKFQWDLWNEKISLNKGSPLNLGSCLTYSQKKSVWIINADFDICNFFAHIEKFAKSPTNCQEHKHPLSWARFIFLSRDFVTEAPSGFKLSQLIFIIYWYLIYIFNIQLLEYLHRIIIRKKIKSIFNHIVITLSN